MRKIVFSLLGLVLFLYILFSIGVAAIVQRLLLLNLFVFSAVIALLLPSLLLKGFKQKLLVAPFQDATPLFENIKIWLVGFFFGIASPAKSGDAIRALYLKNFFGISLGQGLAAVFMERILDLFFLFAIGFIGLLFLTMQGSFSNPVLFSLVAFFAVFILGIVLLLKKELTRFLLKPFFNAFAPQKLREGIKTGFNDFYQAIATYGKRKATIATVAVVTAVSWLIIFYQLYLIALALSIELSFLSFALVLPIILLIEALPISVGGLGTREAASIIMLGFLGIGATSATSFSLTVLLLNLIVATLGFLFFNSMRKPI